MKIVVGTTNQRKIAYLRHFFSNDEVFGIEVESGVSHQPLTEAEVMEGAYNRAQNVLKSEQNAEIGVGMEGGSQEGLDGLLYYICVVVMATQSGETYMGISSKLPIPKRVSDDVKMGKFLVDELKKIEPKNELIDQLISREKMFKEALENVITMYQNKDYFN